MNQEESRRHKRPRTRVELLAEARELEQIGGEWEVAHVAAFCGLSIQTIYNSDCPRVEKRGDRAVVGKHRLRFIPADVKTWNAKRTVTKGAAA